MRTINSKGFGLIGLIITFAIIAMLVFGAKSFSGKNQIETGQDAIDKAQDAADKQRRDNQTLQDEIQGLQPDFSPDVYHNIQDRAKNIGQ